MFDVWFGVLYEGAVICVLYWSACVGKVVLEVFVLDLFGGSMRLKVFVLELFVGSMRLKKCLVQANLPKLLPLKPFTFIY